MFSAEQMILVNVIKIKRFNHLTFRDMRNTIKIKAVLSLFVLLSLGLTVNNVSAHCDRENGPVAKAAREALEKADFNTIVVWVGQAQENELKQKFNQSLTVYKTGGDSKKLAEQYFMETAVRLHREAEGFPYEGLKPASPNPPDIEAAEKALETGDFLPVIQLLNNEMDKETSKWFDKAMEAKKDKDTSVEAGRAWVDAYVKYIVFIHSLYDSIQKGPAHGV